MTAKEVGIMRGIKSLASETLLRAAKDYCDVGEEERKVIIEDLNGKWLNYLSNGMSKKVAEELIKNEPEIRARLKKEEEAN